MSPATSLLVVAIRKCAISPKTWTWQMFIFGCFWHHKQSVQLYLTSGTKDFCDWEEKNYISKSEKKRITYPSVRRPRARPLPNFPSSMVIVPLKIRISSELFTEMVHFSLKLNYALIKYQKRWWYFHLFTNNNKKVRLGRLLLRPDSGGKTDAY